MLFALKLYDFCPKTPMLFAKSLMETTSIAHILLRKVPISAFSAPFFVQKPKCQSVTEIAVFAYNPHSVFPCATEKVWQNAHIIVMKAPPLFIIHINL